MTITRLELLAMIIGVRCIEFVRKELKLEIEETYLFTDSQCALKWTETEKALPVFIKNRVKEIKSHGDISFRYVSTKENPADVASRGVTMDQLQNNQLWWHGSSWLSKPKNEWKIDENFVIAESKFENTEQDVETKKNEPLLKSEEAPALGSDNNSPCGIKSEKYSSAIKLFRVTALDLRFIKRIKKQKCETESIASDELLLAENLWILHLQRKCYQDVHESITNGKKCTIKQQLGVFIDKNGLLRCRGRLENANISDADRYPILLPKKDHITRLIIERDHKQQLHSGLSQTLSAVRYKFWIPSGRATVGSVLRQCILCRKIEGGAHKMPSMPPFPKGRVTEAVAFERTGLDYLGPLYMKTSGEYRKRAPWYGGYWERLVGLVKRSLRKSLGHRSLTDIQLQTVIKEIESVINSRPLLYVDDDINSNITLTPGHFLTLNPRTGIPEADYDDNDPDYKPYESSTKKLLKLWNKGQKLLNNFWEIWKKEYLISLRERTQSELKSHRVQSSFKPSVGDVVLIKDDLPRGLWKMGKVIKLIMSNDGQYRSAKVNLSNGRTIGRTLNHLYPVEVSDDHNSVEQTKLSKPVLKTSKQTEQTRPKRKTAIISSKRIKELIANKLIS
ncbi:uncharacterized protein LOC128559664 [Mercenaria mercenaria]|uniref:uncharacterized protein LOC128559664 n=1 Tax=Mercenaria mercenaria TaxID=6596 RepID=UPI00234E47A0|nr:uncharacterized protein LOC128559664 [Mercenaria mercenaria]